MDRRLDVEAGFPVAAPLEGAWDVLAGALPAGRDAVITHGGHPAGLVAATATLLTLAQQHDLVEHARETADGTARGCRLEVVRTDPRVVKLAD